MKHLVLFSFFLAISVFTVKAQSQLGAYGAYGIPYYKVVVNTENTSIDYEPGHAYEIELNYKNRWPGVLNFGTSLSYQYQSSYFEVTQHSLNTVAFEATNYELHYINFKIFPEYVIGDKIKYYFQLGPALSFMVSSNMEGYTDISNSDYSSDPVRTEFDQEATEDFAIANFLIFTGIGIDIPVSSQWKISGNVQYQINTNTWFAVEENVYGERGVYFKLGAVYIFPQLSE